MKNDNAPLTEPYRELLSAILRLAIEDAKRPTRAGANARHWLTHSPVARDYLLLMNLDPDEVIRRLAA